MKMRRWILIFSICLLQGCVYVPPVWDGGDAIHGIEEISEGVSTRQDVLDVLGEPPTSADPKKSRKFIYRGHDSYGYVANFLANQSGTWGTIGEEPWSVIVTFDDGDYVETIATSRSPLDDPEQRELTLQQAEEGSPEAQYEVAKKKSGSERLKWLCRSANGGLPLARYQLGLHVEAMTEPDYAAAYVWHRLAAQDGLPAAQAALERLSTAATGSKITEAEHRVASWQPDPASCDALAERWTRAEIEQQARACRAQAAEEMAEPHMIEELESMEQEGRSLGTEKANSKDQYNLGQRYYQKNLKAKGKARTISAKGAWHWVCVAAHNDNSVAQRQLEYWLSAEGAKKCIALDRADIRQVYLWFSLAVSNGSYDTRKRKSDLAERMTPTMLAEAKQLVKDWKPDPSSCGERPSAVAGL